MLKENDQVMLIHTGEVGKVLIVDDEYKQAEIEFSDGSYFVYSFEKLRKVGK